MFASTQSHAQGSLVQKLLAHALLPTLDDSHAAHMRYAAANPAFRPRRALYGETAHRRAMRDLLNAAGAAGLSVEVAAFKEDKTLRLFLCVPVPNADTTAKYVTVLDLELTEQGERPTYRRVCLDTITGMRMAFRACDNLNGITA